jgi:erythromycin esterase-like protein
LENLVSYLAKKRVVMLGEASHGTQEFYAVRRLISTKLIAEHGFSFIAVEGDWPDCAKINEFVKTGEIDEPQSQSAEVVLSSFTRWPTWMWANTEVAQLMRELRRINKSRDPEAKAGFYGLDVYSLFDSATQVVTRLKMIDPKLAALAERRYKYFFRFGGDEKKYIQHLCQCPEGAKTEVVQMLKDLLKVRLDGVDRKRDKMYFDATQNSRIVDNADNYYRAMIFGTEDSWNVRDRHMIETLDSLLRFNPGAKAIVWAHNTHVGDHNYTSMKEQAEVNIGGLARELYGNDVALVGFGTYQGKVLASRKWGSDMMIMDVPPARTDSHDGYLHRVSAEIGEASFFWINEQLSPEARKAISQRKGQRAIGVVYKPEVDHLGNYVPTDLHKRYDAFIFINKTGSLSRPVVTHTDETEVPETYPSGF